MDSFNWGQYFETGLDEVDEQHHHLVNLINQFGRLLSENQVHIDDVDRLYHQLSDYAVYHFHKEEKLMAEIHVDPRHLSSHIDVHRGFLEEVSSIYSSISIDDLDQAKSFFKFLTHWLVYHILGKDQDMAKQIHAIKSGVTPLAAYDSLQQEKNRSMEPLMEALDGLLDLVSMRNKQLKKLNASLEEKVALRTEELYKANQYLEEMSLTDVLTGLPNRRHAMRFLASCWNKSLANNSPLICIMIDADHFKEVNDSYGHDAGDLVLKELAKTLRDTFRTDDLVCRLGGDEFLIICPNTDKESGMHIAELARKAIAKLCVVTGGKPWHGSMSVGVACRTPDMLQYEDLIKVADKGVYAAKKAGKNCVRSTG
ncbi:GGDEF domain-containing protein [Psychromonas sp. MME2]|uniref:GGDEF domain-containing protein n=1 Tax=unclassified Psychromonas TaxID=2614957 RepID=UPI00339CEC10